MLLIFWAITGLIEGLLFAYWVGRATGSFEWAMVAAIAPGLLLSILRVAQVLSVKDPELTGEAEPKTQPDKV